MFLENVKDTGYEVIIAVVIANISAQILKTIVAALQNKRLDYSMLITTGGMPSSHTSSVIALSASIGMIRGFGSIAFSIAVAIAAVVMYDAQGIRRSASKQASVLNKLIRQMPDDVDLSQIKLKELLGHSPQEVLAGAVLGIIISIIVHICL